LLYPLN